MGEEDNVPVGIIGGGRIGSRLFERLKESGEVGVAFVLKEDGVYKDLEKRVDPLSKWKDYLFDVGMVFLAIPTLDDGETAYSYIKTCLDRQVKVVTCEKGALSKNFHELRHELGKRVGFTATVGGGTEMLPWIKNRVWTRPFTGVHMVLNGTLNYMFDELSKGRDLDEVGEEVRRLGYAEPGEEHPLAIMGKEIRDTAMKTAIVCNNSAFGHTRQDMFEMQKTDIDINRLLDEAGKRRYIVSISMHPGEKDVIGGFRHSIPQPGGRSLHISAGFKNVEANPLYSHLVVPGATNAVVFDEGENGVYVLSGPGAGVDPTVTTMLRDARELHW